MTGQRRGNLTFFQNKTGFAQLILIGAVCVHWQVCQCYAGTNNFNNIIKSGSNQNTLNAQSMGSSNFQQRIQHSQSQLDVDTKKNHYKDSRLYQSSIATTIDDDDNEHTKNNIAEVQSTTPVSAVTSTIQRQRKWPCGDELDKQLIKITLPCIANYAINPLVGAVDLFWINRMGNTLAVAGQAAANQIFTSSFWLISFLPSVTATLVAKQFAQKSDEGVQDAVSQALIVGTFVALLGSMLIISQPDRLLGGVLAGKHSLLSYLILCCVYDNTNLWTLFLLS